MAADTLPGSPDSPHGNVSGSSQSCQDVWENDLREADMNQLTEQQANGEYENQGYGIYWGNVNMLPFIPGRDLPISTELSITDLLGPDRDPGIFPPTPIPRDRASAMAKTRFPGLGNNRERQVQKRHTGMGRTIQSRRAAHDLIDAGSSLPPILSKYGGLDDDDDDDDEGCEACKKKDEQIKALKEELEKVKKELAEAKAEASRL
ncbi:hypothetical protein IWX49DRAFT_591583 [Phyllosticta citricarpa]|uniref:Uncharacterized protein n=2 Tax=Phyllosticta TaxID=121621 RepID=A0ABR1MAZ6_9PEZI